MRSFANQLFAFCERFGVHVTPVHYYEPIPDTRTLKDDIWLNPSDCVGVQLNESLQLEMLSTFRSKYAAEYGAIPSRKTSVPHEYYLDNSSYIAVDGEILYCMVRHFKPRRVFEIGSGNSTYMTAKALVMNKEKDGRECEFVVFDPYPDEVIRGGFPGLTQVVQTKVENVDIARFQELEENDILFIDSSHVLRIGNDVQYLYLEVLPRLKAGVVIHVHDIFLPLEYPKEWVMRDHFFWSEQYLLQAFLSFNDRFRILWSSSYMNLKHPDKLSEEFRSYSKGETRPCSLWMKRVK